MHDCTGQEGIEMIVAAKAYIWTDSVGLGTRSILSLDNAHSLALLM